MPSQKSPINSTNSQNSKQKSSWAKRKSQTPTNIATKTQNPLKFTHKFSFVLRLALLNLLLSVYAINLYAPDLTYGRGRLAKF